MLAALTVERIDVSELERKLGAGENPVVVDLRGPLERKADPRTIPGALQLPAEELDERIGEIPVGREIILFCN